MMPSSDSISDELESKGDLAKTESNTILEYLPKKIKKKPLFQRLWFLILTASLFIGFGVFYLILSVVSIVYYLDDSNALLADFNLFYAALFVFLGTGYTVFGIRFGAPNKMKTGVFIFGIILVILPALFFVYDFIQDLLSTNIFRNGRINYSGNSLIWIVLAIMELTIITARWKTSKDKNPKNR